MVFSGTVQSDFLKLPTIENDSKSAFIDYAGTDFVTLRKNLINYIKAVYPLEYQNFEESDLGVMLIELVAYMGAVMSLKADMLAHENFLRTAKNRNNVKKLLELIGVRMKGPIAAAANAKITFSDITTSAQFPLTIATADRVKSITSPEDGAPISYTLHKVVNGLVDVPNADVSISLEGNEADNSASSVFTNLVLLEGALVKETGTFASTEATKSIELGQAPVIEGSIQVFIQGDSNTSGAYTQVENIFFASGGGSKVFQIVSNDDYAATVVFGDNNYGISPRAGDSYVVTYRVGGGTRGNIANEVINVSINATDSLAATVAGTLENISIGTGGTDAETVEHAKKYAPMTFRRQDRLVTLDDIKSFVNSTISNYGSVGKATAVTRKGFSSANIIDVYVLEKASATQLRKATPSFKVTLLNLINEKKMLTDEIVLVDGLVRTLDLVVTIRIDKNLIPREEEIKLKVRDKILSFMAVDNTDFGKAFVPEDLSREIFLLEEVRFSTVDNVPTAIQVNMNEIVQLNNLTINVVGV